MKVAALDCDGTLIYSEGPVDPENVKKIGYFIVMVSSSPKCIDKCFDDFVPSKKLGSRKLGLIEVKRRYPEAEEYIYISDNPGDDLLSEEVGFVFIHPNDFKEFYKTNVLSQVEK